MGCAFVRATACPDDTRPQFIHFVFFSSPASNSLRFHVIFIFYGCIGTFLLRHRLKLLRYTLHTHTTCRFVVRSSHSFVSLLHLLFFRLHLSPHRPWGRFVQKSATLRKRLEIWFNFFLCFRLFYVFWFVRSFCTVLRALSATDHQRFINFMCPRASSFRFFFSCRYFICWKLCATQFFSYLSLRRERTNTRRDGGHFRREDG